MKKQGELKTVKARSWEDLPEILEPGIYNVNGEIHVLEEDVPKKAILRALKYKKQGKPSSSSPLPIVLVEFLSSAYIKEYYAAVLRYYYEPSPILPYSNSS